MLVSSWPGKCFTVPTTALCAIPVISAWASLGASDSLGNTLWCIKESGLSAVSRTGPKFILIPSSDSCWPRSSPTAYAWSVVVILLWPVWIKSAVFSLDTGPPSWSMAIKRGILLTASHSFTQSFISWGSFGALIIITPPSWYCAMSCVVLATGVSAQCPIIKSCPSWFSSSSLSRASAARSSKTSVVGSAVWMVVA